jgi:GMP synthase (glutamine-hydrolysing)
VISSATYQWVKLASTHDVEFAAYKIEGKPLMQFNTIQEVFILLMDQNVGKLLVKIAEVPQNLHLVLLLRKW